MSTKSGHGVEALTTEALVSLLGRIEKELKRRQQGKKQQGQER